MRMVSKWVQLLIHDERQSAVCWALLVAFVCSIVYTREVFHLEQVLVVLERPQSADARPTRQSDHLGLSRTVLSGVRAGTISVCRI
jgi:hypothetical protein